MIHVPGKCIPQIITCLVEYMTPDDHVKLTKYQGLVVKKLTKGGEVTEERTEDDGKSIEALLEEGLQEIKDIALTNKKQTKTVQNGDSTNNEKS